MDIRKFREKRGLSQQELADELRTTQQTVGRWEAGLVVPPLNSAVRLADLFNITLDELVGRAVANPPPWNTDELILALRLYLNNPTSPPGKSSAEVIALSNLLNTLAEWLGNERTGAYRNPNGVYMKLMNFRRLDPRFAEKGNVGLVNGGQLEKVVWDRYAANPSRLNAVADAITASLQMPSTTLNRGDDLEVTEAEEGRVLTSLHRSRERNRKLVEQRKAMALRDGKGIRCEGCGFEYAEKYGEHGRGFIEVHHTIPLHTLPQSMTTRLEDLALVCADCHRMIHAKAQWLTMGALQEIVKK
ncbi:helix-turn-helix domain-containing protein [Rhizobium terrae]|uniref:helix-turn-helix domain-containing protein n=1 Tax=Rhizobium terrae TaxID=2171756 RepID=UPI000E3EBFF5|nr:helix-turn-helix domain-containing protein [Rhizobium terrae]